MLTNFCARTDRAELAAVLSMLIISRSAQFGKNFFKGRDIIAEKAKKIKQTDSKTPSVCIIFIQQPPKEKLSAFQPCPLPIREHFLLWEHFPLWTYLPFG